MALSERKLLDNAYLGEIIGQPIKKYSFAQGSKKGDNVIAKLLALEVETESEEGKSGDGEVQHVVIKSLLPMTGDLDVMTIAQSQFVVALVLFPTELIFYKQICPTLQEATGYICNNPKFYSGLTDGVNDYIALEDLRFQGYKMADKKKGLTFDEVILTLETIAKLHAHSYAVIQSDNEIMHNLLTTESPLLNHVWNRPVFDMDQAILFNTVIKNMVDVLRDLGEDDTAKKMEKFVTVGHKIMIDLWKKTSDGKQSEKVKNKYFRVILHGDLWTNNMLFKYSSNNGDLLEDVKFIDFQQCRFGNIYEDLLYFFFTSTTADFRKQHLKKCLQKYFQQFQKILLELNIPLPNGLSEEEVIATFYENLEYGFCYGLVGIPFQLGEPADAPPPPPGPPAAQENNASSKPEEDSSDPSPPPNALAIALGMAEMLKLGAKNSPIAIQRLKELTNEMIKLNVLS